MKRKVGALEKLESDHAALRFKLKRDPQSYRDDFEQQYQQYRTLLDLFLADPSTTDGGLVALKEYVYHMDAAWGRTLTLFLKSHRICIAHGESIP